MAMENVSDPSEVVLVLDIQDVECGKAMADVVAEVLSYVWNFVTWELQVMKQQMLLLRPLPTSLGDL